MSPAQPVCVVILGGGLAAVDRKIRAALDWTLDLLLDKDIVQLRTERLRVTPEVPVG